MQEHSKPHLVWCVGMYASGSTWLYNAAREVAAMLYPGTPVAGHYIEGGEGPDPLAEGINIVKTHHLGRKGAARLAAQASFILITLRDPRDVVTSMMQHMGQSFLQALDSTERSALFAARYAADRRSVKLHYESGFTQDDAVFDLLAAQLGGTLAPAQRQALFAVTRRPQIEKKISKLAELPTSWRNPATGDVVDRDTQWHAHHAGRSGECGRWRRLLPAAHVRQIERHMAGFMRDFGYDM